MADLTIWEHLEDFDNAELPYADWIEQLEDAVRSYNEEHHTEYIPQATVVQYANRKTDHDY